MAGGEAPKRGRGRPPKTPRTVSAATAGQRINPWDGVWKSIGWTPDGAWIAATGERRDSPPDLWLLPVPGVAPDDARPRQVTDSLPVALRDALSPSRIPKAERIAVTARDGLRIEGTLWRPHTATGKRGGTRVPVVVFPHGGPTAQAFRSFIPFKQVLVAAGFAFLDVDFRGSTGYGRTFRMANHDEWGHADVQDVIDAARWAADQPWPDGRLAIYGGSYGGYISCAPPSLLPRAARQPSPADDPSSCLGGARLSQPGGIPLPVHSPPHLSAHPTPRCSSLRWWLLFRQARQPDP